MKIGREDVEQLAFKVRSNLKIKNKYIVRNYSQSLSLNLFDFRLIR